MSLNKKKYFIYRVRNLPLTLDESLLADTLASILGGQHTILIHSLARGLPNNNLLVATVTLKGEVESSSDEVFASVCHLETTCQWAFTLDRKVFQAKDHSIHVDRHFHGFTVLNDPKSHREDCICISGLGASAIAAWKPRGEDSFIWVRDYLPHECPGLRTILYGYDTALIDSLSVQKIEDIAHKFIKLLKVQFSERHLTFIAHSLGGLLLKTSLVLMSESHIDRHVTILQNIRQILLFGVPNKGMDVDNFMSMTEDQPNRVLIEELSYGNKDLLQLDQKFSKLCDDFHINVVSFYETETTPTAKKVGDKYEPRKGPKVLLVHKDSAIQKSSKQIDQHPINMNHSDMVKFPKGSDYLSIISGYFKNSPRKPYHSLQRYRDFVGRDSHLHQMHDFFKQDANEKPLITVITGMNTVGKTSLALEYKKKHKRSFSKCSFLYVGERDNFRATVTREFEHIIDNSAFDDPLDYRPALKALLENLNEASSGDWLIILDDYRPNEDYDGFQKEVYDFIIGLEKGKLIVTSRHKAALGHIGFQDVEHISLGPLNEQESQQLFKRKLNGSPKPEDAHYSNDLLKRLHGYPLAISLLGSYFRFTGTPPSEYVETYDRKRKQVQKEIIYQPSKEDGVLIDEDCDLRIILLATWDFSFGIVERNFNQAFQLLRLWACVDRQNFSPELLRNYNHVKKQPVPGLVDNFSVHMNNLILMSLVDRIEDDYNVWIHPVIFDWCRDRFSEKSDQTLIAWEVACSIGLYVPDRDEDREYWIKCRQILPHAVAFWKSYRQTGNELLRNQPESDEILRYRADGLCLLADLLRHEHASDNIEEIVSVAKDVAEMISDENQKSNNLIQVYNILGHIFKTRGSNSKEAQNPNFEKSLEYFEKAYENCDQLLKINKIDLKRYLDNKSNLASALTKMKSFGRADRIYIEILDTYENDRRFLVDRMQCLERHADLLFHRKGEGDLRKTKHHLEEVYETFKSHYEGQHPRIGRAAFNLAKLYSSFQGAAYWEKAINLCQECLPHIESQRQGKTDIFRVRYLWARLLTDLDRYGEAQQLLEQAISEFQGDEQDTGFSEALHLLEKCKDYQAS